MREPVTERRGLRAVVDTLTVPFRAVLLPGDSRWGMTSLRDERMLMVKRYTGGGGVLDVGCGPGNVFIRSFCAKNGIGIDVFPYEGVEHIVEDMTKLPFLNKTFDTVTLIAVLSHIPEAKRLPEFKEFHRVLKDDGRLVFTEGEPITQWLIHKWIWLYDRVFSTNWDVDRERGMEEGESYCVPEREIVRLISEASFCLERKVYFQWHLNKVFVCKKAQAGS